MLYCPRFVPAHRSAAHPELQKETREVPMLRQKQRLIVNDSSWLYSILGIATAGDWFGLSTLSGEGGGLFS